MPEPNGEISMSAFGATLSARGLSVIAVIVLLAGLAGVLFIDWIGWRTLQAQHELAESHSAQHVAGRLAQLEQATKEHQSIDQKFDAMIYVLALSPEERARLKLKEPPAFRALLDSR